MLFVCRQIAGLQYSVQCCLSADKMQGSSTVTVLFVCRHNCRAAVQCTVLFVCRPTAGLQYSVQCCLSADKLQGCSTMYSVVCLQTNCRAAIQCAECCLFADQLQGSNTVYSVVCLQTQLLNSTGRSCNKHIARLYKLSSVLGFDAVSFDKL